jgi:murein DD-endopeptidase MepM/ murein hydrolase activator NlpD
MKALALVLSAFSGFPAGASANGMPSDAALAPTIVGFPDSWTSGLWVGGAMGVGLVPELGPQVAEAWLAPESSAADEVASELVQDADPDADPESGPTLPRVVFAGCDLHLGGSLAPDAWARDLWLGAPPARFVDNGHTEKDGHWLDYEQIPRRAERPEEYAAYRYPVVDAPVVSGYDLDKPDEEQRRGHMHAVGHGGVDLVAPIGTVIKMVRLDHQVGDAEVLYVGPLYGETVITRHVVREGGANRDYVLLFGHLDHVGDDVRRGRRLREGATVGFVGNSDSPELVHLHLEARRVRNGVDAWRMPAYLATAREYTVVTDPRNVLPLRAIRLPSSRCVPRRFTEPRRYWLGDALTLRLEPPATATE